MIVLFDTNIYISGVLFAGIPLEAIKRAQNHCQIVSCDYIIAEFTAVMTSKKFSWPKKEIAKTCALLFDGVFIVEPQEILAISRDIKDNPILACAIAANADSIVTGDNDLLVLKKYKNTKILTPKAFVALFT